MKNIQDGMLHRAFSLFIFDDDKLLLQQRSAEKITFPSAWTNSCCSHPLFLSSERNSISGVKTAIVRKVEQELGITAEQIPIESLQYLTRIHYLAPSNGDWGEHESMILFLIL
jgi:isopentenyl-diphosphate delta-isomerase